jgi:Phosphotransferase enzyme family
MFSQSLTKVLRTSGADMGNVTERIYSREEQMTETGEEKLLACLRGNIQRKIEERWRTYFPGEREAAVPQMICTRTHVRSYSVLFEYDVRFARPYRTQQIFAKIRRNSGGFGAYDRQSLTDVALARCKTEFEQLSKAFLFFSSRKDGLGVVRPLDYQPEYNAIVFEKALGRDVGLIIREQHSNLSDYLGRCGEWLRVFQNDLHRHQQKAWETGKFEINLKNRIEALRKRHVPPRDLERITDLVVAAARSVGPENVPWSRLHGDYKPRHIWAAPDSIQVIDFGNSHEGECYRDIAAFLVELRVLCLINPWFNEKKILAYSDAFLNGYFDGGCVPIVLRFYIIEALLKKWERRLARWSANGFVLEIQRGLRRFGVATIFERLYLNRWFAARIQELVKFQ